jgi:hypothetical protein
MTDELLFFRRFVEDVRRCAAGRAPAAVAEIEARIHAALDAPPGMRERAWARVVAAVTELLCTMPAHETGPAARLRAFVRENGDLRRARDVSITDFRFAQRPDRVISDRAGRTYLLFAPIARVARANAAALDEIVPGPTRRLAEWAVYALCGSAAAAAIWFAFAMPV